MTLTTCLAVAAVVLLAAGGTVDPGSSVQSTEPPNGDIPQPISAKTLGERVNQAMGLSESQVIALQVDPTPDMPLVVPVLIDGQDLTLDLLPHSLRAPGYRLRAQVADGSIVDVDPGPHRTLRGRVVEIPGSIVAATLMENGLHAMIRMPDAERFWLEPVGHVPGAAPDQYVLYRDGAAIGQGGVCGVNDAAMAERIRANQAQGGGEGGIAGAGELNCTELACDADVEYYQAHGSSVSAVQSQINAIINTVNVQYESEVDIRHEITQIIVRTAEPDPYTSTSPNTLLTQFRNEWLNNQGSVQRDLAQLFTGKNLDGTVIGIAWTIGGICTNGAYCLVQSDFSGTFSCKTDLSSHEMGHLWGGTHCSCPSFTMNPSITCANQHAAGSIAEIIAHRNTRTCLAFCEDGTTTLPFFDDFPSTTINGALWIGIDGAQINTVGLNPPSPPFALNLDGSSNGGDELRSARMSASGLSVLNLQYKYERRGSGDSPETGDDLVVEYMSNTGLWTELHRQLGSGPDMTNFATVNATFPANALHPNFRLRFRAISSQVGADDWLVDDVKITGYFPPTNNLCGSAPIVGNGSHSFTTLGATTDGPDEGGLCNLNGYSHVGNDIWYRYLASCSGDLTVSLCGADFDAKLAIYGPACPGTGGTALACSDNVCGLAPEVTIPVVSSQAIRIRIGGFNGATGSGVMVISCGTPPPPPCPQDVNNDDQVNFDDVLAAIAGWGPCAGCPADVNGDGIVNFDDVLDMIGHWGLCP